MHMQYVWLASRQPLFTTRFLVDQHPILLRDARHFIAQHINSKRGGAGERSAAVWQPLSMCCSHVDHCTVQHRLPRKEYKTGTALAPISHCACILVGLHGIICPIAVRPQPFRTTRPRYTTTLLCGTATSTGCTSSDKQPRCVLWVLPSSETQEGVSWPQWFNDERCTSRWLLLSGRWSPLLKCLFGMHYPTQPWSWGVLLAHPCNVA